MQVRSGDGRGEPYTLATSSGPWRGDSDTIIAITQDSSGYTLTHRDNSVDRYDITGKLLSETSSVGLTKIYSYTSGKLSTVTGPFGHALVFGYNASNLVASVTDSAGQVVGYLYDTNNNLTRVDYPDSTAKIYHYENISFPNHLTGISYVDTQGVTTRYATYAYGTTGKAIRTEHAQTDNGSAQERFTLAYDSDTQTTVTDPAGMNEVMTFSTALGVKNLTDKINQSDGKSVQQTFDLNNNLTCKKDEESRVTTYTYNSTNQKLSMTEGLTGNCTSPAPVAGVTRTTTYEYLSPALDLPTLIESPSVAGGTYKKRTAIAYGDSRFPALPTAITQSGYTPAGTAVSRTVALGYNDFGQVNVINGPRTDANDITTLEYYECTAGGACGQLKKVTNALGHITTYDQYDANGRLKQMTDPNGFVTSYNYDPRGRVKTITRTGGGITATWQYSYTPWGDVSQVIDPDDVVLNYQYDAAHDLRFIVDTAGNYIHYKYDLKGNRTQDYTYDLSGVLTRTVSTSYDLRNHPNSSTLANDTTQLVYDAVGNLTHETDPNNHTTTHTPDALNRLMSSLDALNGVTGYGYDVNDRPKTITAPNNLSTQYEYDDLGNLLKETSRDRGTTSYAHDAAGNVLTVKDALNITTTYTYDALNRVASKQSSNTNTPRYAYFYDGCSQGRLCSVSRNGVSDLLLGYDGLGRMNFQLDLGTMLYSNYTYTPGGRLTQIGYPSDRIVDYRYDFQNASGPKAGNIVQVTTTANDVTTVLAQNFQYYPFGPANSFSFGNGRSYFATFDMAYRPSFQLNGPRTIGLIYDPAGNLSELDAGTSTQTFGYDALNELTSATTTQAGSYGSLAYDYLGNGVSSGNRQSETRNGVVSPYTYATNRNRLLDTGSLYWFYDAAGNATWSSNAYTMGYDGYGRMTSALSGAATYAYNAFDQRTRKTASGVTTRFHYGPSGELLHETGAGGKAYVYLNGMPLARVDNDTNIYYYHTDHLGTPQVMTNSAGATVWKANYEPFGWASITTNTITNNVRNGGMYCDQETSLCLVGDRYYDPKSGRWITPDRMSVAWHVERWKANMGKPTRIPFEGNPYVYVANNPLRWVDRTGRFLDDWEPSGSITHDPIGWGLPDIGNCGSTVAQRFILIDNHFGSACKNHDKCYETCKSNKYICDLQFWENMKSACNHLSPGSVAYNWCYSKAWNFYEAVSRHGDGSFNNAQEDACSNCTTKP